MKRIVVCLLLLVALLFACTICSAVLIGSFRSLPTLIKKADAIVVLRVEEKLDKFSQPDGWAEYRCFIYQTLKGDIQAETRVNLTLLDTRFSFVPPFAPWSTHLMFLTKKRSPLETTDYHTIEYQGANIRLSPFGNEKTPEGKTLQERVQSLIRNAIQYWDDQQKKEDEFLLKMLKP